MYIDYKYYSEVYGGGLTAAEFEAAEPEAEAHIRFLTFHNGDIFAVDDGAIKRATCAAVDAVAAQRKKIESGEAGITSESNDGYSIHRTAESKSGEALEAMTRRKVAEAIRIYLTPTGWLSASIRATHGGCRK